MVDEIDQTLVDDVDEFVRNDNQIHYQRLDPWVRNACRRMKKNTFDETIFKAAIRKYVVPDVLDRYGLPASSVDKPTLQAITDNISKELIKQSRDYSMGPHNCKNYVSPQALKYELEEMYGPPTKT
jgi:hypothetical protein